MRRSRTTTLSSFDGAVAAAPSPGGRAAHRPRLGVVVLATLGLLGLCVVAALTLGSAPARAGTFPGANGKLVCAGRQGSPTGPTGNATGDLEIFTMNPDGSDVTYLTNNFDPNFFIEDNDPAWSPDGRRIAFERDGEVFTMNADGSAQTRLTFAAGEDRGISWSPDGRRIWFHSQRDGNLEIYSMNADGTDQRNVTNSPSTFDVLPVVSVDGTVAFDRGAGNAREIHRMNPDGTGLTRLTNNAVFDGFAVWSPDGRQLAFESTRDDPGREVYTMNADGTGAKRLTTNTGTSTNTGAYDGFVTWSPDGTTINFTSSRSGTRFEDADAFNMNAADGGGVTRVTSNPGFDGRCDWQPIRGVPVLAANVCPTPRIGTEAADTINGTPGDDRIFGLGGNDVLNGVQGNDCLFGGEGNDSLQGSEHNDRLQGDAGNDNLKGGALHDRLSGGSGRDRVLGGAGRDRLYGGAGNDSLDGGRGPNRYSAGAGNDRVNAANGRRETVNCGSGRRDVVRADRSDRLRGCERRRVVR